jgi:hypothetical protein
MDQTVHVSAKFKYYYISMIICKFVANDLARALSPLLLLFFEIINIII